LQSIYNRIPINQEGFNNITNLRKKEVKDLIENLTSDIKESKNQALSLERQVYILNVSSSNFFKTNSILNQSIKSTASILKSKGKELYNIDNGKKFNEYALASRFYLENSLNGWQGNKNGFLRRLSG
jgi:aspartate 1-decarboxylase